MTEHEAAKPKRPRDQEFEDAPIQESIRGMSPRVIKRNPSSDQKRVRREMQRKTAGEETELSRLLVEAAASDNPFGRPSGDNPFGNWECATPGCKKYDGMSAFRGDKYCKSCMKAGEPDKQRDAEQAKKRGSKTAAKPPAEACKTCGNLNFNEQGSCTRCGRVKTAAKTAAEWGPKAHSECKSCGKTYPITDGYQTGDKCPECAKAEAKTAARPLPTYPGGRESTPSTEHSPGDVECKTCGFKGAPTLGDTGKACRNCNSYSVQNLKQRTAEKTTRATCPDCGVGLIWGECPNCGYKVPAAKKKTAGAAGTYAGPSPTGGFHHWMGTDSEKEDQCISCGVVAPDHGEGVMSDHSPLPIHCPGPDGAYNAHHYTDAPDGKLDCAYCTHQVHDNSDPERDLGECLSPERGPIPASHPNSKKYPEYSEDGGDNAYGRAQDSRELRKHLGSKTAAEGISLGDMEHGDERHFNLTDQPDSKFRVTYHEWQPNGDNGQPANGYRQGVYTLDHADGHSKDYRTAPFRPGKDPGKTYMAEQVKADLREHLFKRKRNALGSKTATHFDTQADKLNPGDMIRTPTGQTVKVLRMRNHETSPGHAYMDTDQGTSVVRRKAPVSIVPFNSQQQELPGYGIPGGNTNRLPMDPGNVGPSKQTPSGTNQADPNRSCPVCGGKGTLARRGQSYVCSKCGYRENVGAAGPGKGFDFTDAPQRLMRSSSLDQKSAIARRAQEVLETTEEIQ